MSATAVSEPTRASTNRAARAQRSLLPKVFGYDFFISFKLGSPPPGAQSYASDLARCLRERDYTVFFSEEEAAPGAALDATLVKALRRSRILVVIATSGALRSPWVRKEVEEFRARRDSRPVILINVDRAIDTDGAQIDAATWLGHEGRIWLDETAAAVQDGIVSKAVVDRIRLAPQFLRANLLLRVSVTGVILTLSALTAFAWFKNEQSHDRLVAYNLSQGRAALTGGRALEAAPSLLRALQEGEDSPEVRFMLARAFASVDMLVATFDSNALTFSPDGKAIAIARKDGWIEIRNSADLSVTATLQRTSPAASALTFAPDGKSLLAEAAPAGAADREQQPAECVGSVYRGAEVTLWDTGSGGLLQTFQSPQFGHDCQRSFFADEGKTLATTTWTTQLTDLYWAASSFDRSAALLGTTTATPDRKCIWSRTSVPQDQQGIDLGCPGQVIGTSDDGALLAVGPWSIPQRAIDVWSLTDGSKRTLPFGRDTFARAASFSADSERIAITLHGALEVWSLDGPARLASVSLESTSFPAAFSPDGTRLIAQRGERDALILDAANLESLAELTGHATKIRTAIFSSDGTRVLTGGDDGVAKLWDGWTGRLLATLEGHRGPVIDARFSPDDHLIFTRDVSGRAYLWNNRSQAISRTLRDDPANVRWWSEPHFALIEHSPEAKQVVLSHSDWNSEAGNIYALWDTTRGLLGGTWRATDPPARWPNAPGQMNSNTTPQCASAPASLEKNLPEPLALDGFGGTVVLESSADAQNALLKRGTKPCESIRLEGHRARITAAAIDSSTTKVMTADESGEIRVWNAENGLLLSLLHAEPPVRTLAFLDIDRALALNELNTAVVLDVSSERRPAKELQQNLLCSALIPTVALADLTPPSDTKCRFATPERNEWATAAATALLTSAWGHRHRRTAEARLLEAAALYEQAGDAFGAAQATIALRALSVARGDAHGAAELGSRAGGFIAKLAQADDQRLRLFRLGERAFNEFGDVDMARLAWTELLARSPRELPARLALWETLILDGPRPDAIIASSSSTSMREAVLFWIAAVVTGKQIDNRAYGLWSLYAGTTIDPVYERLDFRGLRQQLETSSLAKPSRRLIGEVLKELEQSGNRADRIKRLLGVPDEAQTVGP